MDGNIDLLIVPIETGALITGLAKKLKLRLPSLKVDFSFFFFLSFEFINSLL